VCSVEHGSLATVNTLEILADKDIYLVPTQTAVVAWARHAFDDDNNTNESEYIREKRRKYAGKILEYAGNVAKSNVKIAFGTDLGTFDYLVNGAVEFSEMVRNGITPLRALRAASSVAAELLQLNAGSIVAGKYADIIAMPGNPLQDITFTEKVNYVMKNGIVYRNDN
jgi:imidazolonepropionase-like amidohydrolase